MRCAKQDMRGNNTLFEIVVTEPVTQFRRRQLRIAQRNIDVNRIASLVAARILSGGFPLEFDLLVLVGLVRDVFKFAAFRSGTTSVLTETRAAFPEGVSSTVLFFHN